VVVPVLGFLLLHTAAYAQVECSWWGTRAERSAAALAAASRSAAVQCTLQSIHCGAPGLVDLVSLAMRVLSCAPVPAVLAIAGCLRASEGAMLTSVVFTGSATNIASLAGGLVLLSSDGRSDGPYVPRLARAVWLLALGAALVALVLVRLQMKHRLCWSVCLAPWLTMYVVAMIFFGWGLGMEDSSPPDPRALWRASWVRWGTLGNTRMICLAVWLGSPPLLRLLGWYFHTISVDDGPGSMLGSVFACASPLCLFAALAVLMRGLRSDCRDAYCFKRVFVALGLLGGAPLAASYPAAFGFARAAPSTARLGAGQGLVGSGWPAATCTLSMLLLVLGLALCEVLESLGDTRRRAAVAEMALAQAADAADRAARLQRSAARDVRRADEAERRRDAAVEAERRRAALLRTERTARAAAEARLDEARSEVQRLVLQLADGRRAAPTDPPGAGLGTPPAGHEPLPGVDPRAADAADSTGPRGQLRQPERSPASSDEPAVGARTPEEAPRPRAAPTPPGLLAYMHEQLSQAVIARTADPAFFLGEAGEREGSPVQQARADEASGSSSTEQASSSPARPEVLTEVPPLEPPPRGARGQRARSTELRYE
jgi:hypothetical protein